MTAETHRPEPDRADRSISEKNLTPNPRTANFNRLARLYRWMEYASFGPWLWWCRCAFLLELRDCRRAVAFGDGDGRFTARLLADNPTIKIDAIDASPAMLRSLVRRAGDHAGRVRAVCADARAWQPCAGHCDGPCDPPYEQPYDLVVTHFFLDCLTTDEVRALAAKMRGATTAEAQWVVSEFAQPENLYGRVLARPIVRTLYRAFGLLTGLAVRALPDYDTALRAAGFTLAKKQPWLGGLLVSELWLASE